MTDDFNLYPLHVFLMVARLGSVTRAARELFISQPAVSSHIRALEDRYGGRLFERTPRGMALTEAGRVVLRYAQQLFALRDEIPSAISSLHQVVRGEITVAASSTPGAYLMPGLLSRFEQRHPEAKSRLLVGDSAEVVQWVSDYQAPMGVIGETASAESLFRVPIGSDELRLVARAGDPLCRVNQIGVKHMEGRTFVLREPGSSTRAGAEAMLGDLIKACGRVVELRHTEAIKQMVAAGLGVAVLSSWATQLEETARLLAPVRDKRLRRQRRFYLARRQDRELTGAAGALWRFLTDGHKEQGG